MEWEKPRPWQRELARARLAVPNPDESGEEDDLIMPNQPGGVYASRVRGPVALATTAAP